MACLEATSVTMAVSHTTKMSHKKLQWTDEEIRILLSLKDRYPNASFTEMTDKFNEAINRTRTEEAVKSQLKKQAKIRSNLQKGPGASSSKPQIREPAQYAAHSQSLPLFSEAGKFKVLHLQLLGS
jgi:hypothetical protein